VRQGGFLRRRKENDMTDQEIVLGALEAQGRADALSLRERAAVMDGTALIAEERKIPQFDPGKDYSAWAAGAPVWEDVDGEHQVFALLQPHNAASYPGSTPSNAPALWSIRHTKDPARAKAWMAPSGTSGMYAVDECAVENGHVWRSAVDSNVWRPSEYPAGWEDLGEVQP